MTTLLGASASLLIRVGALALAALLILLAFSMAAMADTISVTPTGPAPVPDVPTITLWRDGVIMVAIVILIVVIVWRASMLDLWVHSRMDLHGMAAALMHDEMQKRGLAAAAPKAEPEMPPLNEEEDPWVAEANKVAPPPPAPTPRRVAPSTKAVATTFSPRRARGEKMQ